MTIIPKWGPCGELKQSEGQEISIKSMPTYAHQSTSMSTKLPNLQRIYLGLVDITVLNAPNGSRVSIACYSTDGGKIIREGHEALRRNLTVKKKPKLRLA